MKAMEWKRLGMVLVFSLLSLQVLASEWRYACHPERFTLAEAEATYAYGQGYEEYEYSFEYLKEYWTASVYRFYQFPNTNSILKDITLDDSQDLLIRKIYRNASKALEESSIADSVSEARLYVTDQKMMLSFTGHSILGQQHYSFFIHRESTELHLYRVFYIAGEDASVPVPDVDIYKIMRAFVQSCQAVHG